MNRKKFLFNMSAGTAALMISKTATGQPKSEQKPPPYPIDLVKEFVIAGHGDFVKVQAMLKDHPNLIYCKYDWGNGDFEAAIEGAGHVGNKEIANYLLEAGSRLTLYVMTMLGKTALVKPFLETYPSLLSAKGPHGFTLLHHAKVGGGDAEEIYHFLQSKGLSEDRLSM